MADNFFNSYLHNLDKDGSVKKDRKSTRLNSSHDQISYAVFCLKKKRFARQNRCGPPPGFPLASSWPGIGHHLSGPNVCALGSSGRLDQTLLRGKDLASIRTPWGCARSVRDGITPRGCTLIGAASLSLRLASLV